MYDSKERENAPRMADNIKKYYNNYALLSHNSRFVASRR